MCLIFFGYDLLIPNPSTNLPLSSFFWPHKMSPALLKTQPLVCVCFHIPLAYSLAVVSHLELRFKVSTETFPLQQVKFQNTHTSFCTVKIKHPSEVTARKNTFFEGEEDIKIQVLYQ